MHVAEVTAFGGPEVLRLAERPDPAPAPGRACRAHPRGQRQPHRPGRPLGPGAPAPLPELQPPFVPGWDLAGEVTAVGSQAKGFAPGDRVLGMIPFGRIGSAAVHPGARIGVDVSVEENVVIKQGVSIGSRSRISAGCVLGAGVSIGQDCLLFPNVTIYPGTRLGDRVVVHAGAVLGSDGFGYVRDQTTGQYEQFPQIGRLEIEDDVDIGANATVDRGALEETRIRRGTKIDNLVHVGHNVEVGEDVVIAAQTGVSGSSVIGKNAIVGGQVGIADHVTIEEGAILGAQSGIPSSKVIRGKGVVFWGTPARPIRQYLKELAVLARLAKKE